jgi:hypothetical protein
MTVDGEEALVVAGNGKSGEQLEADITPREHEAMERVKRCKDELDKDLLAKKAASERAKLSQEAFNAAVSEMLLAHEQRRQLELFRKENGAAVVTATEVNLAALATPSAAGEAVLNGTTGSFKEQAEGEYEMTPDPENPKLCVCGWFIKSEISGHDHRHREHLAAEEALRGTARS